MREQIETVAGEIYASLKVSINGVKGAMLLPPKGKVPAHVLIFALGHILSKHFNIRLEAQHTALIAKNKPFYFLVESEEDLPARSVSFDFDAIPPKLKIAGTPPKDGRDGYTDIAFDWQKRSGTVNPDGTFDWKKINSVPSVREKEVIATVYDRTEGEPGVDCFGKIIRQKPGYRHQIRWVKNHVYRDKTGENLTHFSLLARSSGVVNYAFKTENDPRTLEWVSISDTLKIAGDIDYSLGDLDSAASLDIDGSVLGNFSLKSDGHIHVSGTIEGQGVEAKSIHADLITNRCCVSAKDDIETRNITNAEANSEYIRINNNASRAVLNAKEKIIFDSGSSVTGVTMRAKHLQMDAPVISGKNEIVLGGDLFSKAKRLRPLIGKEEAQLSKMKEKTKDVITTVLTTLLDIEKFTKKSKSTILYNLINGLKTSLADSFKSAGEVTEATLGNSTELLNVLGERNFAVSILRKAEKLCRYLREYNSVQAELAAVDTSFKQHQKEFEDIAIQVKHELAVLISGASVAGGNVALKINCGDAELILNEKDLSGTVKEVRYTVKDEDAPLSKGKLRVLR